MFHIPWLLLIHPHVYFTQSHAYLFKYTHMTSMQKSSHHPVLRACAVPWHMSEEHATKPCAEPRMCMRVRSNAQCIRPQTWRPRSVLWRGTTGIFSSPLLSFLWSSTPFFPRYSISFNFILLFRSCLFYFYFELMMIVGIFIYCNKISTVCTRFTLYLNI